MKENYEQHQMAIAQSKTPSCDCTKYNGGQCYNCLNGGHEICDSGQGKCSLSDRKTYAQLETRLRQAEAALAELDPLDVYEKTIEIEKRWKQRAEQAEADLAKAREDAGQHWVYAAVEACAPFIERVVDGSNEVSRPHLRYMLGELRLRRMSATKACRWLGWIQAAIYADGSATLEQLKAINKAASDAAIDRALKGNIEPNSRMERATPRYVTGE